MRFTQSYLVDFKDKKFFVISIKKAQVAMRKHSAGRSNLRGRSSVGRAADLHSAGHRFEPVRLHHFN